MSKPAQLGGTPIFSKRHVWPKWPQFDARDEKRLLQTLHSGAWGIGSQVTDEFGEALRKACRTRFALPVGTGTAALELIVKALGIGPGDEVIVPAYTFIASATAVLEMGATVVFADLHPQTFNLDPDHVAKLLTPRTRAVIAVHFAGNPVDIAGLRRVLKGRNVAIIEDAAHAHGMLLRGKAPGHHGIAAAFSYQTTKNMSSGEGGAIVTNDRTLHQRCWSYHSFGRLPGRAWYEHHAMSWNHRLAAFQSAVLLGQLRRLEAQTRTRHAHGAFLNAALAAIPGQTPQADGDTHRTTRRAYHIYMWRYDAQATGLDRETFLAALQAEGVPCSGGYPNPLPQQPMFQEQRFWHSQRLGGRKPQASEPDYRHVSVPIAEQLCRESIWLPQSLLLGSRRDMQGVVDAVGRIVAHAGALAKRPHR